MREKNKDLLLDGIFKIILGMVYFGSYYLQRTGNCFLRQRKRGLPLHQAGFIGDVRKIEMEGESRIGK